MGITIIYFNNEKKNHYVKLPPDIDLAKKLAKCIYRDAKVEISKTNQKEQQK